MLHDYLYNDGYGYDGFYVPSHDYYRWKRQEELRRRQELEQAYRREQQERYLRNLRLREEHERQMRRRRELELREALAAQHLRDGDEEEIYEEEPRYQLVRGMDGFIYRVPLQRRNRASSPSSPPTRRPSVENVKARYRPARSGNHRSDTPDPVDLPITSKVSSFKLASEAALENDGTNHVAVNVRVPEAKEEKKSRSRRKVTVIVEDASDSEDENDELKSVWRNRRPSPGEWIEPVDFS